METQKVENDDPRYCKIKISLSLAFLATLIPLARLFPSKSGVEKPNMP